MSILNALESPLLLGATGLYLAATLLFCVQLFFWTQAPSTKNASPGSWGVGALWLGALAHLGALAGQGPALFTARPGVVGLFSFVLVVSFLLIGRRLGGGAGAVGAAGAFCGTLFSFAAPELHTWSPGGRLEAFWLAAHVFVIVVAYVALAFAFAASVLYLLQESLLKRRKLAGLWQKLPPLGVADEWIFRATAFGLALLTLGLVVGVAFNAVQQPAYEAWRDPKVLFSGATWLVFALYLGARWRFGWHGRRSTWLVITGFALVAVSFLGVPHLVPSP